MRSVGLGTKQRFGLNGECIFTPMSVTVYGLVGDGMEATVRLLRAASGAGAMGIQLSGQPGNSLVAGFRLGGAHCDATGASVASVTLADTAQRVTRSQRQ